jgi:hypothetical protein
MHHTTIIEEQPMENQQSSDTNENSQETNATDVTKYIDSTQSDSHEPHIEIDNLHTMTEQQMRSKYGREIKPTMKYKQYKQQPTVKSTTTEDFLG